MLLQLLKIAIKRIISRATQPIRTKRADRTFTEALQLFDQGDMPAAERLLRKTIEICPNHARARSNLGSVLWEQNRFEDGIACLKMAVTLDPDLVDARVNLGIGLYLRGAVDDSIAQYRAAIRLDPDHPIAHLNLLILLLNTCDWDSVDIEIEKLLSRWEKTTERDLVLDRLDPFISLLLPIPQEIRRCTARHRAKVISRKVANLPRPQHRPPGAREKLRIGYLSNAFNNHATAHLATGMFEQHDRRRFECYAYSYGVDDGSEYRRRLATTFDAFIEVGSLPHESIAQRIANDGIDILVDLNGYTYGGRPEILALRPAPIQVHYLGYPATLGADFIDYFIADATVAPEEERQHFSEQVVWLPACYQVNDRRQRIDTRVFTRAELGLPNGFIYCSFNQHAKIERHVFDAWLRILAGTPGSALWLLEGAGERRLRERAVTQGIDPKRIVFAKLAPKSEHLARLRLADLCLDTSTCNAHTPASDALWAGVPVLTCPSKGFAGRVASSLLKAIHLPELIVDDLATYESRAIAYARDPASLCEITLKLENNRLTTPLFDTARFTADLERAYEAMWARLLAGGAPQRISID